MRISSFQVFFCACCLYPLFVDSIDSRQQRQHYLFKHVWGKNYNVPLESPTLIIHWCCGSGLWGYEMAKEFPDAIVVGIDHKAAAIDAITKSRHNLIFQDVLISEGNNGFEGYADNVADYILMREVWIVNSPYHKWHTILEQVFRVLKPGGWVEIVEQDMSPEIKHTSDNKFGECIDVFTDMFQIDFKFNHTLGFILKEIGYIAIYVNMVDVPIGEWPPTPALRQTGYLFKELTLKRMKVMEHWVSQSNKISEEAFSDIATNKMNQMETSRMCIPWYSFKAQKPL
ncbi:hypothetical protein BDF14DRAFT_916782 [Spinellus fusiger]|nr:hypothetical protein BDF14DRAFT_916782 [Spinellus fusiger]